MSRVEKMCNNSTTIVLTIVRIHTVHVLLLPDFMSYFHFHLRMGA